MGKIGETPGERVVRLGKEKGIKEHFNAGDMHRVNELLQQYPYGTRPPISLEQAHAIARNVIRRANQPTESHEVITQAMLDAEAEL